MKIRLSVVIACVLLAQVSMAQISLGIKGGATLSKIDGKSFSQEFTTGYHLGGFLELGFGGRLGIQPEVLFNQVNTRVDSSFKSVYQGAVNFSGYKDIKLNYLSIPILLNYKVGHALSLQAGPQFGVLMSQDKNLIQNGQAAFKNGDLSMVAGAQLKIAMLRLSGRYFAGLKDIGDVGNPDKWTSRGWQLSVGIAL